MNKEHKTVDYQLSFLMMLGSRILEDGDVVHINYTWQEDQWVYCNVRDDVQDVDCDFMMCAVLEDEGETFLLLDQTPNVSEDSPYVGCFVTKLIALDSFQMTSKARVISISEKCQAVMNWDKQQRFETLSRVFGSFKSWEDVIRTEP